MNFYILNFVIIVTIMYAVVAPALAEDEECTAVCHGGPLDSCTNCGSGCAPTCDNYDKEIFCAAVCIENICQCSGITVRDESTGQCVLTGQCPQNSITHF